MGVRNRPVSSSAGKGTKAAAAAKAQTDDDADLRFALKLLAVLATLMLLLLVGMKTGYTPCYFMQSKGLSCGSETGPKHGGEF